MISSQVEWWTFHVKLRLKNIFESNMDKLGWTVWSLWWKYTNKHTHTCIYVLKESLLEIILVFCQLELQRTSSEWMIQRLYSEPATLRRLWLDSTTDSSDRMDSDNNTTSALTFTFTLRRANVGVNFIFAIPLLGLLCLFMFFLVVVWVEGVPKTIVWLSSPEDWVVFPDNQIWGQKHRI